MPNTISQFVRVQPGATGNIRRNFPGILEFVEAYYEWLELDENAVQRIMILKDQRNIDLALDEFLKYFKGEFLHAIPTDMLADPRKLAKRIKDFYRSRGSEKSFRLLFRILYNEPVEFYYPKVDILRVSDGKWSIDSVIRTTTNTATSTWIARQIEGVTSGATAWVENVVQFNVGADVVSEMYLSNVVGTFDIGELVECTLADDSVVTEETYGLVTGITITNPGTGYRPEDIISVTGNTTGLLAVDSVFGEEAGRVRQATPANYPQPAAIKIAVAASAVTNYYRNMFIEITEGPGVGEIKKILTYSGPSRVATIEGNWSTVPTVASRYKISLGKIKTVKVRDFGINYSSALAADFSNTGNGDATGTITFGAYGTYAGRFVNTDGFLSNNKYLQDSHYYQDFSYVLQVAKTVDEYRTVVKDILHPASLALFGNVTIQSIAQARRVHNMYSVITTSPLSGSLPLFDLVTQYAMLEDLADSDLLYDVSGAYPTGLNALLGSINVPDVHDPAWGPDGQIFLNSFVDANIVPVNKTTQTIIIVAKPDALAVEMGLMGSIDTDADAITTGYQIKVSPDGSLTFRAQKYTSPHPFIFGFDQSNDLTVTYPAGSIVNGTYFCATLRYAGNTLVGNLNTDPALTAIYSFDVDGVASLGMTMYDNSRGHFIGIGGFHGFDLMSPIPGSMLGGSGLSGVPAGGILSTVGEVGYWEGDIAYVLVYDRYLEDQEVADAYLFLTQELLGRGIALP